MMRRRRILHVLAVTMLAVVAGLVAATPAQAHPIYRRAFGNQYYNQCLWAADVPRDALSYNYVDSCGRSPNTGAKWKLHVVADNWNGSGHEEWVLESIVYPSACLNAGGHDDRTTIGSCGWAGDPYYNTFEAFWMGSSSGGGIYQLKSIRAWKLGVEWCLTV